VQVTRRGRALVQRTAPRDAGASGGGAPAPQPALRHDRLKALPIPGDVLDPFLQKIGLQTEDGRVRAAMQVGGRARARAASEEEGPRDGRGRSSHRPETKFSGCPCPQFIFNPPQDKFVQVNKFLELLIHTGAVERLLARSGSGGSNGSSSDSSSGGGKDGGAEGGGGAVRLLDCGCGSAHLTLGAYHYLANIKGLPVELTGVDSNAALMERSNRCGALRGQQRAGRAGGRGAGEGRRGVHDGVGQVH
jgi:hypothetical protein